MAIMSSLVCISIRFKLNVKYESVTPLSPRPHHPSQITFNDLVLIVSPKYPHEARVVANAAIDTIELIQCQIRAYLLFSTHALVAETHF